MEQEEFFKKSYEIWNLVKQKWKTEIKEYFFIKKYLSKLNVLFLGIAY